MRGEARLVLGEMITRLWWLAFALWWLETRIRSHAIALLLGRVISFSFSINVCLVVKVSSDLLTTDPLVFLFITSRKQDVGMCPL